MTVAAHPAPPPSYPDRPEDDLLGVARKIRAILVDDQLLEREVMRRMLRSEVDIEIVGTCADGREAVLAINRCRPDLVFLDVQMPELDGFGVISRLDPGHLPAIIFVTANEEFARRAFDVHALDYLIKPCTRERFRVALQRAREEIRRKQTSDVRQRLSDLLNDLKSAEHVAGRLAVRSGDRILVLHVPEIEFVEAAESGALVHLGKESHLVRDSVAEMESRLPTGTFIRINRSTLVNVECIKELQPASEGAYAVVLRDGKRLTLTSGYRDRLHRLGL